MLVPEAVPRIPVTALHCVVLEMGIKEKNESEFYFIEKNPEKGGKRRKF